VHRADNGMTGSLYVCAGASIRQDCEQERSAKLPDQAQEAWYVGATPFAACLLSANLLARASFICLMVAQLSTKRSSLPCLGRDCPVVTCVLLGA